MSSKAEETARLLQTFEVGDKVVRTLIPRGVGTVGGVYHSTKAVGVVWSNDPHCTYWYRPSDLEKIDTP